MATDTSGTGFLAGEYRGGLTTVKGSPQSAAVHVFYEEPDGDWSLVSSVVSGVDGTWLVGGLNHELPFHVRGVKEGYADVFVSGVYPTRTDVVEVEGGFRQSPLFNGVVDFVEIVSGASPFSASVTAPLPFGLFPVVDGRKLLIDGVSTDVGLWDSVVTVSDVNGVQAAVPVRAMIGLAPPLGLSAKNANTDPVSFGLEWVGCSVPGVIYDVFLSQEEIDPSALPAPFASLPGVSMNIDGFAEDTQLWWCVRARKEEFEATSAVANFIFRALEYKALVMTLTPICYWPLDEASGTVAHDMAGTKNGQFQGSPTLRGPAIRSGSDGCAGFGISSPSTAQVYVGTHAALGALFATANHGTFMLWYKHVANTTYSIVFAYYDDPYNGTCAYRLNGPQSFQVPHNQVKLTVPVAAFDGQPHMLVFRKSSSGYTLFVDGEIAATSASTVGASGGDHGLCFPGAAGWNYYPSRGYMSDVAAFDYAVSDEDIAALYLLGSE